MSDKETTRKVILTFVETDKGVQILVEHQGFEKDGEAVPLYVHAALESMIQ